MYSSWLSTLILCENIYILNPKAFKDSYVLTLSSTKEKKNVNKQRLSLLLCFEQDLYKY